MENLKQTTPQNDLVAVEFLPEANKVNLQIIFDFGDGITCLHSPNVADFLTKPKLFTDYLTEEQQITLNEARKQTLEDIFRLSKDRIESAMLDFANYCIGEGFTSSATQKDLEMYLEMQKP